ncbi:MAG: DUF6851 domain-containing protein [Cytophagaceae bacterium]
MLRLKLLSLIFFLFAITGQSFQCYSQTHTVARKWNEAALFAIRKDFARPTIHARNLYHLSIAMYDAWAVYDDKASTFFLNHSFRSFYCPFNGVNKDIDKSTARNEAISYAAFRLLSHRFKTSPGAAVSLPHFEALMLELGYDPSFKSSDYSSNSPAALGNYIAEMLIEYGFRDGSNEINSYKNRFYKPGNPALNPNISGNSIIKNSDAWQPLSLELFIDQNGIPIAGGAPPFLSPEWGRVIPFALKDEDLNVYNKDGNDYWVYHDPGDPPKINSISGVGEYLWTFSLVSIWASHLDPADGVMIDISPASQGNVTELPSTFEEMKKFYNLLEGGDAGKGYELNPKTGQPYAKQMVPRGDYTRALAEYWADGPSSETPPGHWFSIVNYVSDHPLIEKKIGGTGEVLDNLEWDVKSYLTLGGAVHDAAICAWGIKGYYDYVRPISAIRAMCERGQCTSSELPRYNKTGIPLIEGYIELVKKGDPLQGNRGQNIDKIKLYTWRGPGYVQDPTKDVAGVGWILAENWWPYQRPTFVTPPFAGYISGHSTFSAAAAQILTLLTGDEYFPGGMSEFKIKKDQYLVFEKGPSTDITLQWAKYKDAADQCSLSRIWGGIHPPADDIPGRKIGKKVGIASYNHAIKYFSGEVNPEPSPLTFHDLSIFPNPISENDYLYLKPSVFLKSGTITFKNLYGQEVYKMDFDNNSDDVLEIETRSLKNGLYMLTLSGAQFSYTKKLLIE